MNEARKPEIFFEEMRGTRGAKENDDLL